MALFTFSWELVGRQREDFVTWVDNSKIRRHVLEYNDKLDDYDML